MISSGKSRSEQFLHQLRIIFEQLRFVQSSYIPRFSLVHRKSAEKVHEIQHLLLAEFPYVAFNKFVITQKINSALYKPNLSEENIF